MNTGLSVLLLSITASILLWFGYSLFVRFGSLFGKKTSRNKRTVEEGKPGAPRTCPVCSIKLIKGERVKSSVFPAVTPHERLMHISGCPYCLDPANKRKRACPVCGASLKESEVLIARMFEKPGRSHVHVLGCSRCKGPRSTR